MKTITINLSKIAKTPEKTFKTKSGETWATLVIWENDELDKFGNSISVQLSKQKDEKPIYVGNGRDYKRFPKEAKPEQPQTDSGNESDDLPF